MDESYVSLLDVDRISAGQDMPDRYYRAGHVDGVDNDGLYIHNQLSRVNLNQRKKACKLYSDLYAGENVRSECNTRLREFADKCENLASGKVYSPKSCVIGGH